MVKVIQPGVYYFGDLCYVTASDVWGRMCEHMPNDDAGVDYTDPETGINLVLNYTKYGDGSYHCHGPAGVDFYNMDVDSGSIGITLIENIPSEKRNMIGMGATVEIKLPTTFSAVDGLFKLHATEGIYEVDTGEYEHEETEDDYHEYYNYYDDEMVDYFKEEDEDEE